MNQENKNSVLFEDKEVVSMNEQEIPKCCDVDQKTLQMIMENAEKKMGNIEMKNQLDDIRLEVDKLTALLARSNVSNFSGSYGSAHTSNAAIHLTSSHKGFNKPFDGEVEVKIGPWEAKHGITLKYGITTHDLGMYMVAPEHGIYYIYSQAYFQDEREGEDRKFASWKDYLHYTIRETDAYQDPITLMKSGRAEKIEKTSDLYYSSYHGGVFELRKGDKICMKAYLPRSGIRLDYRQESTFMGMYLVNGL
uniref:Tumor necrosis factor ligand superfamily member 10-like n=1 Tax=Saccoglossus kowalevskii TaxID=10224 RepID=A0ABM0M7F5_SACKO|nr:PREDICTED: tumor necrosis factor ligand superfamily member 10-like [Saccoglossus kowalevskii]